MKLFEKQRSLRRPHDTKMLSVQERDWAAARLDGYMTGMTGLGSQSDNPYVDKKLRRIWLDGFERGLRRRLGRG